MMISSEKANNRAARAVEFAAKHRWAKYPCVAAVSVIYSAEYLRCKAYELGEKAKAENKRPLGMRIGAGLLSCAFSFMALPVSGITVGAESMTSDVAELPAETADELNGKILPFPAAGEKAVRSFAAANSIFKEASAERILSEMKADTPSETDRPAEDQPEDEKTAATPETIAKRVHLEGLPEKNDDYDITLNIKTLKRDVTVRFSESSAYLNKVEDSFAYYSIPTDDLFIQPVDITMYSTKDRYRLNLAEGYTADITLPIPQKMMSHLEDLKVIRLEKDGTMTILEGDIARGENGGTISFTTEHFSVFALVSYNTGVDAENIGSGAGMNAAGTAAELVPVSFPNVFEEDKRRFKDNKRKRKVYRIKRIMKESDKLI